MSGTVNLNQKPGRLWRAAMLCDARVTGAEFPYTVGVLSARRVVAYFLNGVAFSLTYLLPDDLDMY